MSKFFFKGRLDARQDHTGHGYQTNAAHKPGSKKFPLQLVVTSKARKEEVQALVKDAGLYAEINIDTEAGAAESIEGLNALLTTGKTVEIAKVPQRNEACSCGSGKKYKKCCG
ncbi:MAG: zinc chelation protein SecC [Gammaproteobacteria bacterium]|nr:MAG: zinc chelation protein SecC [Gammaproteobacteria bacterium]